MTCPLTDSSEDPTMATATQHGPPGATISLNVSSWGLWRTPSVGSLHFLLRPDKVTALRTHDVTIQVSRIKTSIKSLSDRPRTGAGMPRGPCGG